MTGIAFLEPPGGPALPASSDAPEPDGPGAPPSSGVPLRDRLVGVGVVVLLLAILGGTVVWRVGRDDAVATASGSATDEPGGSGSGSSSSIAPAPEGEWPPELMPLVRFVEQTRGAPFTEAVPIEFLDEEDYEALVLEETTDITPEDQADLDAWAGQMRALGLLDQDTDIQDAIDQAYGEGTLAFYDTEDEKIRVLGTEVDVAGRVTLVHELVHAWQDQQGFLEGYDEMEDTEAFILQTLVEGDATRIEDLYVETLSSDDFDDYQDQSAQQGADADLSGIPSFMLAGFYSPYALGGPLVTIVAERGGNAAVDEALADPPASEADLVSPARFFDQVDPLPVAEPTLPEGAVRLDGGPFGALSWHLVLSEHVDPRLALDVADWWGGDNSVTYDQGGRTCTAAAYRPLAPTATDAVVEHMTAWADRMTGHDATVERLGEDVVVRTCESSEGADVAGRSETALQYPVVRLEVVLEGVVYDEEYDTAVCFGDAIVDGIGYEEMQSGAVFRGDRLSELGAAASRSCPG